MIADGQRRHQRPRIRAWIFITAATTFVLGIFFLLSHIVSPDSPMSLALALSSHPIAGPDEPLGTNIEGDNTMATTKKKHHHHKDDPPRKFPQQILTFPADRLPSPSPDVPPRRLIFIGDVHGHIATLEALLDKVGFSPEDDTVIFTGDLVNKGPDSAGVLALAMRIGAFGVRGNHDDSVIRAWENYEAKKKHKGRGKRKGKREEDSQEIEEDDDDDDEEDSVESTLDEKNPDTDLDDAGEEEQESDETASSSAEEEGLSDALPSSTKSSLSKGSEEEEGQIEKKKKKKDKKHKGKKGKGKDKKKKHKKDHDNNGDKPSHKDLKTAKSLLPAQRTWLSSLPLILSIGDLGPRYGDLVVVHGGLVPGIPLESQDPVAVMTMRTLLLPDRKDDILSPGRDRVGGGGEGQTPLKPDPDRRGRDGHNMVPSAERDGVPWARVWTGYYETLMSSTSDSTTSLSPGIDIQNIENDTLSSSTPATDIAGHHPGHHLRPITVVYGHDARSGLKMRRYAFGLDTGCGSGEELTAAVFEFVSPSGGGDDSHKKEEGEIYYDDEEDTDYESEDTDDTGGKGKGKGEEKKYKKDKKKKEDKDKDKKDRPRRPKTGRIRHRLVSVSCVEEHEES